MYHENKKFAFETNSSDTRPMSLTVDNLDSQPVDVPFLNSPGVYEILDTGMDKSYYGETGFLFRRFMQHWDGLQNETHECKALLQSFKNQDKNAGNFRFIVHKSGPQWARREDRLEYENMLVQQNKNRCYNSEAVSSVEKNVEPIRKQLYYKVYSSARDAARGENLGRTTILRHLSSLKHQDVYYLQTESFGHIPVFAKQEMGWSVLFSSMKECVDAKYATNVQNARRKMKRKEPGWSYAHVDENGKPLRIPYTLKPGQITYLQYCELFSFVFLVNWISKNCSNK